MRKFSMLFLFVAALSASLLGQVSAGVQYVTSAPSGSCTAPVPMQQGIASGLLYSCQGGTWAQLIGTGGSLPAGWSVSGSGSSQVVTAPGAFGVGATVPTTIADTTGVTTPHVVLPGGDVQAQVNANAMNIATNVTALGTKPTAALSTDGTAAANSDANVPSQKAMVTYVGAHAGGATTAKWERQGVVIAANATDSSPQAQEPSAMWDTAPEVLTGYNSVVKMSWTDGWWYSGGGGTGIGLCFGESPDGLTPPTRISGGCPLASTVNHARSYMLPTRQSGNIVVLATDVSNGHGDIFTGTTLAGLTKTSSTVISCGSNGSESAGSLGNWAIVNTSGSNWTMLYECLSNGNWSEFKATSTAGYAGPYAKSSTSPVIGDTASDTASGKCVTAGGPWLYYDGTNMYAATTCGPGGNVPSPWIYLHTSTNGGSTWTPSASPMLAAQTYDEGIGLTNGQIADPFILPDYSNTYGGGNRVTLLYAGYTNGCPAQTTCSAPSYIKAATANTTLANLLASGAVDGGVYRGSPQILVNGAPLSYQGSVNIAGSGVSDGGNGKVAISGTGSSGYVSTPSAPSTTGSAGQWAADGGYHYTYDPVNVRWQRIAWDGSWLSGTLSTPTFSPVAGTYMMPLTATIGCTAGAAACYTTNGNTPTAATAGTCDSTSGESSVSCGGTATISATSTLKAIATKVGQANSTTGSVAYVLGSYQTQDNFLGTSGTLLTAHTDLGGHTWALYSGDGASPTTPVALNGSGSIYGTGATLVSYGDLLNSLTPSSANYTTSITCTLNTVGGFVALFDRSSSGSNSGYYAVFSSQTGSPSAYVNGFTLPSTALGSVNNETWNVGDTHTLALKVNSTTVTAYLDGSATSVTGTNSTYTTAGQTGFRISGNNSVTCTNFTVQ
jgi:hypothetical protein